MIGGIAAGIVVFNAEKVCLRLPYRGFVMEKGPNRENGRQKYKSVGRKICQRCMQGLLHIIQR